MLIETKAVLMNVRAHDIQQTQGLIAAEHDTKEDWFTVDVDNRIIQIPLAAVREVIWRLERRAY